MHLPHYSVASPPLPGYKLDPCPFCGDSSVFLEHRGNYHVHCWTCGAASTNAPNANYVIWCWNRRIARNAPRPDWSKLPLDVVWWCVNADGRVAVSEDREPIVQEGWPTWEHAHGILDGGNLPVRAALPLGVDWRTTKHYRPTYVAGKHRSTT